MRPSPPPPPASPAEDEFRFGWRFVPRTRPDGSEELAQVPLTLEDVLHPREGDVIPERPIHEMDRGLLASVFRTRAVTPRVSWVSSDQLVDWGVAGLRDHAPDVAVFAGLAREPDLEAGTLRLADLGGRCLVAVEVVSPHTRGNDVDKKVEHYHRAGVRLYVLIDQEREGGPRTLVAHRWASAGYQCVEPDESGRVFLGALNLHLTMRDNRPVCIDAETGRELGDYAAVARELDEADARAAERERLLETLTTDFRAQRLLAEQAEAHVAARVLAEQQAEAHAVARVLAEQQAEQQAARADAALAAQVRQMQELLARLQGTLPGAGG